MQAYIYFIKVHLWTQIRSNCHVERFVVKRIIDQYKNRMFIHCRRGLYRKAWLSRDIYLSCVSQYWRGIKRAAMLTSRYGRSFQWGKSLSKDVKNILDELTDCYGGSKNTIFIKYGAFSKTAEKFKESVNTVLNIWKEHCWGISTRSAGGHRGSSKKFHLCKTEELFPNSSLVFETWSIM